MKRLLFLICTLATMFFLAPVQSEAQTTAAAFTQTVSNPTGLITNTSVDTMYCNINLAANTHGIQLTAIKTAGTIAGSAILYGTIDGTRYIATGDTVTLASMQVINSNEKSTIITKTNPPWAKYRWVVTGSGTVTMTMRSDILGRRLF